MDKYERFEKTEKIVNELVKQDKTFEVVNMISVECRNMLIENNKDLLK